MDFETDIVFPRTKIGRDHQMRDMFRNGKVIERKMDKDLGPLVRVQYLDKQGLISKWLQVKQFGSRKTLHSYAPKIGDDVSVTMLPNGSEDGFVDGSFFNKRNPPPEDLDLDTRHYQSEDGTTIQYREKDSTFVLDSSGASGGSGPAARAGGGGAVQVSAGVIMLTAPEILITGNIQHTGLINTTGVHTDLNGVHMGGKTLREEELEERVKQLEERVTGLEMRMLSIGR